MFLFRLEFLACHEPVLPPGLVKSSLATPSEDGSLATRREERTRPSNMSTLSARRPSHESCGPFPSLERTTGERRDLQSDRTCNLKNSGQSDWNSQPWE